MQICLSVYDLLLLPGMKGINLFRADVPIYFNVFQYSAPCQKQPTEVFCKKGVFKNFAKLTGKHLCQIFFLNTGAGLRPATYLIKRLWHGCFPVNFAKFLRKPVFIEHLWWLLLNITMFFKKWLLLL